MKRYIERLPLADVQPKRRANLIPNLVETVKGYVSHERGTLEKVVAMRNKAQNVANDNVAGPAKAEGDLDHVLGRLFSGSKAYPDQRPNQNFAELQSTVEKTEGEIQMARRYYNGATRDLNIKVESFPNNIIAEKFGFDKLKYFKIVDPAGQAVPQVSF